MEATKNADTPRNRLDQIVALLGLPSEATDTEIENALDLLIRECADAEAVEYLASRARSR